MPFRTLINATIIGLVVAAARQRQLAQLIKTRTLLRRMLSHDCPHSKFTAQAVTSMRTSKEAPPGTMCGFVELAGGWVALLEPWFEGRRNLKKGLF